MPWKPSPVRKLNGERMTSLRMLRIGRSSDHGNGRASIASFDLLTLQTSVFHHRPKQGIISGVCSLLDDTSKSSVVIDREPGQEKTVDPSGPRIRCPLCGWSPRKDDRWSCNCGHEWNTFDTGGVCPSCLHQWASTQCLKCGGWSPHSDWYAK